MFSLKSLFTFLFVVLACATTSFAKKEEEDAALRDMQIGMAGLKEAAGNPALLAQLMRDMAVSRHQLLLDPWTLLSIEALWSGGVA